MLNFGIFVLIGVLVAAVLALATAVLMVLDGRGQKPRWLPFILFQCICRCGATSSVEALRALSPGIFTYTYDDVRYERWREVLMRRERITAMEWLALDSKMYEEQERVRSTHRNVSIDQEFALAQKEPGTGRPRMTKVVVTRWNVIAILGWVNVVMGLIALVPALFWEARFYHLGSVFGLVVGGILVSRSGRLKVVEVHEIK